MGCSWGVCCRHSCYILILPYIGFNACLVCVCVCVCSLCHLVADYWSHCGSTITTKRRRWRGCTGQIYTTQSTKGRRAGEFVVGFLLCIQAVDSNKPIIPQTSIDIPRSTSTPIPDFPCPRQIVIQIEVTIAGDCVCACYVLQHMTKHTILLSPWQHSVIYFKAYIYLLTVG